MMRYIFAILTAYLAVVSCQNRPPQPMETDSQGGVSVSSSLSTLSESSSSSQSTSSRPKGCSPGCGPTEICAELGASYCTGDRVCSVCIKMSSIRFPASALAGLFGQQQKQSEQQFNVPAQQLPSVDPFSYAPQSANTYNDPFDIFGFNTFNDPLAPQQNQLQSNNMFNFMMFEGFGGGLGF